MNTTPMDFLTLWINGLPFKGWARSQMGFNIRPQGLTGWSRSATARRGEYLRQGRDGGFAVPSYLNPRVVTVDGFAKAGTMWELGTLQEQLDALNAPGVRDNLEVVVEEFGRRRWAIGGWADGGAPNFEPFGGAPRADIDFSLIFHDPLRYGDVRRFPQEGAVSGETPIEVFHKGTYHSSPTAYIEGSGSAPWAIIGPNGRRFESTRTLSAGQLLEVNLATGQLKIGSTVITGETPRPSTWALPSNMKITHQLDTGGNSMSMYMKIPDAF